MDLFWSTTVPNWITAIATFAALVFAAAGARAAWRSLQSQLRRDEEERRGSLAARSKSVTAQWVRRWRKTSEGGEPRLEMGLLITNHGTTPAFDVVVEASAQGMRCELPVVDPLHPGELFIRSNPKGHEPEFEVKRMGVDIERVEVVFSRQWLVHGVEFVHDGEVVRWRSREHPAGSGR